METVSKKRTTTRLKSINQPKSINRSSTKRENPKSCRIHTRNTNQCDNYPNEPRNLNSPVDIINAIAGIIYPSDYASVVELITEPVIYNYDGYLSGRY